MPKFPYSAPHIAPIQASVYSNLARSAYASGKQIYPLHIGDTYAEPPEGCRMEDLLVQNNPGMHRYAPVHGLPLLVDAVVEKCRQSMQAPTERHDVLITAGATGALAAVVGAMVSPGEEMLILAPHWPLISGMVQAFGASPVQVPFVGTVTDPESALAAVEAKRTSNTVAIYINSPNNPTGVVLPRAWLEALVEWALSHDIWVLADEVYEDYVYEGTHTPLRSLCATNIISIHSFSKAFGMAGNRAGYMAGPKNIIAAARKVSTHTYYCPPTASQLAALHALQGPGQQWVEVMRPAYASTGAAVAGRLGVPAPQGSTFLFIDVGRHLDARGLQGFLEDCAQEGLLIAPGPSFGPFPHHIRLCFTAAAPEVVMQGVEILARRMHQ